MNKIEVINKLKALASHDPKDLAGMARFGIKVDKAWVISIPTLRQLAKEIRSQVGEEDRHRLAQEIWQTDIHEAKILAGFIDVPRLVTRKQMEIWVLGFDSWDVTDMICGNLFDRTEIAIEAAKEWSRREEEFVKRAGFVLMAGLAVHRKELPNEIFVEFLELIEAESWDDRNYVRKAVSWALRQIGKSRNGYLYRRSLALAQKLYKSSNKSERWIGSDAYRELVKDYIKSRF